jgi:hypothetical protein
MNDPEVFIAKRVEIFIHMCERRVAAHEYTDFLLSIKSAGCAFFRKMAQ